MNTKEVNEALRNFWNEGFKGVEPMLILKEDVKPDNNFDEYMKLLGDECERVIDIGTGFGIALLTAKLLGSKIKKAVGIDTSENAIDFINRTCELSHFDDLEYLVNDNTYLESLDDNSFDGVICSNVLDVIPLETSQEIIKSISRILKSKGLLFLKFNFYLTEDIIEKIKMDKGEGNTYFKNGILRGVNVTTEDWIKKFEGFDVVKLDEFQRIPNGPKDRIILLRKK